MAAEAERERHALNERLSAMQAQASAQPAQSVQRTAAAASAAARHLQLSESDTRQLIDEQLRAAGWEADTAKLSHRNGVRPQKAATSPSPNGSLGRVNTNL